MQIIDQYFSRAKIGESLLFDMAKQAYGEDDGRALSAEFPTRAVLSSEVVFEHAIGIRPRDIDGQFEILERFDPKQK